MIYYDIQHHGAIDNIEWLISLLSLDKNFINLSYDGDTDTFNKLSSFCSESSENLSISRSLPVTWCGPSQIIQMKKMLERSLEVKGWKYFVNLSGVDFPLLNQKDFIKKLEYEESVNGKTSFCFGFKPKKEPYWIKSESSIASFKRRYFRLDLYCDSAVNDAMSNGLLDPVRNVMQRRSLYCEERANKSLFIRGLNNNEMKERKDFWNKHSYYVGRTWVVLHRKQVEWLLSDDYFNIIYEHLLSTFEPDETLIPTALFSNENPYINELSKDNLRFNLGAPGYIGVDDIGNVFRSGACFARKLALDNSGKIKKMIEYNLNS